MSAHQITREKFAFTGSQPFGMTEKKITESEKSPSAEWFLRGILTRLGETVDRFTGRSEQASSSIATSELTEKLRKLLDSNVDNRGANGLWVPHIIKLKTQWDKFSSDSDESMAKLRDELLVAAIDHINDNRYHTVAPIEVEVKPDYFTKGVQLAASFDARGDESELNVAMTQTDLRRVTVDVPAPTKIEKEKFVAEFSIEGKSHSVKLEFDLNERKSVGRSKESDLTLEDGSVSKIHATFLLNAQRQILVADTGSSNGTFINGNRIAYGKAHVILDNDRLQFGDVEVLLRRLSNSSPISAMENDAVAEELDVASNEEVNVEDPSSLSDAK